MKACAECGGPLPVGSAPQRRRCLACVRARKTAYYRAYGVVYREKRPPRVAGRPKVGADLTPAQIEAIIAARLAELRRDRTLITTDPWEQRRQVEYVR